MKKLFILFALSFLFIHADRLPAQNVGPVEWEFQVGGTLPLNSYHGGSANLSTLVGMELRYNIKNTPLDAALSVGLSCVSRNYRLNLPYYDDEPNHRLNSYYTQPYDAEQLHRTVYFALGANYNFGQGKKCNPFAGLGVGYAAKDIVHDVVYGYGEKPSAVFIPRFGVELFRHIRVTCSSHITRNGYNDISLALGVVFGGGMKKNK